MTPPPPASIRLTADDTGFLRNGRPHRIVSAAIHYFRVLPELWEDRLRRLRAMGVNTVETYVAWNVHEPRRGEYRFTGPHDLAAFLRTAADLGLDAIVRPGPYICAEWEFGGLPAWLLADRTIRLRGRDPRFLAAVDAWFDVLLPVLRPLLSVHGGPVVAMGVENEYGSHGNDTAYLAYLRDGLVRRGADCLLFTADGAADGFQLGGRIPGVLGTGTFGARPERALDTLRRHQPTGPLVCMEYWHGWFDHWGEPHHVRSPEDAADTLDRLLAAGASVNIYMGHGGTNFGWWNGANHDGTGYRPTVTSYDYDAPVGEAGELTPKFRLFREVIERHTGPVRAEGPPPLRRLAPRTVRVESRTALLDSLDALAPRPIRAPEPLTMEEAGQALGLIHYRTRLRGPLPEAALRIDGLADRAQVFLGGRELGVLERDRPQDSLPVTVPDGGARLDVLVENQGRINYGPLLADRKGISGGLRLDNQYQLGWETRPLPLDDLSALDFRPGRVRSAGETAGEAAGEAAAEAAAEAARETAGPSFHRARVDVEAPADGFLALPGWTKGMVWLNGFALGRYWERGPLRTLYAPAPLWRCGENTLVVLELHRPGDTVEILDLPRLGTESEAPVPEW